jgi:hypothetical protein
MNRLFLLLAVLCVFFGLATMTSPAFAQVQRVWVGAAGDDTNPCSPDKPCRSFAGALSKVAAGGEINCLDSGAYGGLTITKSISIVCDGVTASISATKNGVVINGPGIMVLLSGLEINGFGTGLTGVQIREVGTVIIRNSSIRNFAQRGIDMQGTSNNNIHLQNVDLTGNTINGFFMEGQSGAVNNALIQDTFFTMNGTASIEVIGPSLTFMSDSMSADATSIALAGGAMLFSYGTNIILGNGTPTQVLPRQ